MKVFGSLFVLSNAIIGSFYVSAKAQLYYNYGFSGYNTDGATEPETDTGGSDDSKISFNDMFNKLKDSKKAFVDRVIEENENFGTNVNFSSLYSRVKDTSDDFTSKHPEMHEKLANTYESSKFYEKNPDFLTKSSEYIDNSVNKMDEYVNKVKEADISDIDGEALKESTRRRFESILERSGLKPNDETTDTTTPDPSTTETSTPTPETDPVAGETLTGTNLTNPNYALFDKFKTTLKDGYEQFEQQATEKYPEITSRIDNNARRFKDAASKFAESDIAKSASEEYERLKARYGESELKTRIDEFSSYFPENLNGEEVSTMDGTRTKFLRKFDIESEPNKRKLLYEENPDGSINCPSCVAAEQGGDMMGITSIGATNTVTEEENPKPSNTLKLLLSKIFEKKSLFEGRKLLGKDRNMTNTLESFGLPLPTRAMNQLSFRQNNPEKLDDETRNLFNQFLQEEFGPMSSEEILFGIFANMVPETFENMNYGDPSNGTVPSSISEMVNRGIDNYIGVTGQSDEASQRSMKETKLGNLIVTNKGKNRKSDVRNTRKPKS